QSGSSSVLGRMNRNYTREEYLEKIAMIRRKLPLCALSTDIITGFPDETDAEHQETLSLLRAVRYDYAFTFIYSERPNTPAAKHFADHVPAEVKQRRLEEIIAVQRPISEMIYRQSIGSTEEVLVEGESKREASVWMGRTDTNRVVLFPRGGVQAGDFVRVKVETANSATLFGSLVS
ncbi:MAG: TRAM domain-containing protein, partial [Rhizobacter sp.]|nr:TRAM domain-containing protein [Chlorobiales bacterium]